MKTKIFILLILLMLNSGCKSMCKQWGIFCPDSPTNNPGLEVKKDLQDAQEIIDKSTTTITKATKDINKEADNISKEATEAKNKIPEEAKEAIDPHLDSIKESSNIIKEDTLIINIASGDLTEAQKTLKEAEKKAEVAIGALDKITKERDEAIKARDSALHKAIRWLIISSIIAAAGLGVFGLMYSSKLSLTLSATCIIIMSIAIFINTYFIIISILGGVVFLGLIAALIWNIIIQKRAFSQVVDTVEVAQENLSNDAKKKLFGEKGQTGIMDGIQSKSTMDLVKKQKNKMSNLWTYSKNNGDK